MRDRGYNKSQETATEELNRDLTIENQDKIYKVTNNRS